MNPILQFIENSFRFVLLFAFDLLLKIFLSSKKSNSEKTAIIRVDAIGDFIIWLDAAKAFERKFGKEQIVLIVNEINCEIASALPYWDEVFPINMKKFKKNFNYRFGVIKKLSRLEVKIAINTTYSRAFWQDDSIVRHTNSVQKIGILGDYSNDPQWKLNISNKWYNKLVPSEKGIKHELIRNAEFLNQLGIEHKPGIHLLPPETFENQILEGLPEQYFVVFPGTSTPKKEWGINNFVELINILTDKYKIVCIVCGGKENLESNEKIVQQCNGEILNLTANTGLKELISIIKQAKFIVSGDTSAIHIAASTNTKGFCILGGGHFGRFLPYQLPDIDKVSEYPTVIFEKMDCYNCLWKCIFQKHSDRKSIYPCIAKISVEKVIQTVVEQVPS